VSGANELRHHIGRQGHARFSSDSLPRSLPICIRFLDFSFLRRAKLNASSRATCTNLRILPYFGDGSICRSRNCLRRNIRYFAHSGLICA
jgi:hypothetical protein